MTCTNGRKSIMDKTIRDGKVAVLVSYGYGAGFSTWNSVEGIEFEPIVVGMIEQEKSDEEIQSYLDDEYSEGYWGGVEGLRVEWLKEGTEFIIDEYDGSEHIEYKEIDNKWTVA